MQKTVLVDLEKIKDPFCGLGQFCLHLREEFTKSNPDIKYWIPTKFTKLARKINLMLPYSEVFHAIHQDSQYIPFFKKTKFIITFHDLNALAENRSELHKRKIFNKYKKRIKRADAITFISEFAKEEVAKNFDLTGKKLKVIYNGISLKGESQKPDLNINLNKKFLFTIGTVLPKKNFHVLIDMMKKLPDYQLVIAGTTYHHYAKEMQERIIQENLQEQIFLIGTIDEAHKIWFYENAQAFIFPSLLEGFGLPIAEAMSKGLPLFLSTKTSVPEIGGPDAYYFEHFEPNYMAKVFLEGMNNFNSERKERLIQRSKIFSWKNAASEYLKLYNSL